MSLLQPLLFLFLVLLYAAPFVHAQSWTPQKNVEIVVPSAPGGTNDKLARQIERTLPAAKLINSTLSVVHKAGAGGQLAYNYLATHAGDAHYLLISAPTGAQGAQTAKFWQSVGQMWHNRASGVDYFAAFTSARAVVSGGKDQKNGAAIS